MPTKQPRFIYGILGNPVSQSLSPLLHNWGFGLSEFPGVYLGFAKTAAELPDFMHSVRTLPVTGLSVTIPHKEAIIPYLDALTDRAKAVGAVNTVFWKDGKLVGENTDVAGFLGPLVKPEVSMDFSSALVLGAGGAARAVLAGIAELGIKNVLVVARRKVQAETLVEELGPLKKDASWKARGWPGDKSGWDDIFKALPQCLVINTTPLGMYGKAEGQSPIPADAWPCADKESLAYDLVYNPARTRFLEDAAANGWKTQEGLDFFAIQGQEQFRLWTSRLLPLEQSKTLLRAELKKRADGPGYR